MTLQNGNRDAFATLSDVALVKDKWAVFGDEICKHASKDTAIETYDEKKAAHENNAVPQNYSKRVCTYRFAVGASLIDHQLASIGPHQEAGRRTWIGVLL